MVDLIINVLTMTVPFSVALLLASLGEMFNQRAGVFNLGCEGIMAIGAFLGMLVPFSVGKGGAVPQIYNILGFLASGAAGAALGVIFGVVVVKFRAPQGIAGIGLQMFGVGTAGTLFRHFVGGTQSIVGMPSNGIPLLKKIPILGDILFSHGVVVYLAFLFVPLAWYILFKTSWGLKVRSVGAFPLAADTMGVNVKNIRYQALALGGALAGLAGAYLSICQAKMFNDTLIAGRGFIAVALVYFGQWHPLKIMFGALLFSAAQTLQYNVQGLGLSLPYEFFVMFPYVIVVVVLSLTAKNQISAPTALGTSFDRETRV